MALILDGTTGITTPGLINTGTETVVNLTTSGNTTLGDASGDTLTLNGSTVSTPNGLNFDSNTFVIDATNNRVGVGTASPSVALDISSGNGRTTAAWQVSNNGIITSYTANTTGSLISNDSVAPIIFSPNNTERMRIDQSGNVGIGNTVATTLNSTSLAANLAVGTGATHAGVTVYTSPSTNGTIAFADGTSGSDTYAGYMQYQHGNNSLSFGNSGTERMRLDTSGNVLVNTTSTVGSYGRFEVVQTTQSAAVISADATNANFDYKLVYLNTTRAASTAFDFIQATTGSYGAAQFRVRGDGNVYNTNGVYSTVSDIKLKENITDATSKLEKLNQVRVVNYNLKDAELKQIGFIAQELEQVFPSLVEDNIDKDVSGNDLGTVTKSVKLTVFIPILVKAIQEQQALINDLTARLTALENK